MRFSRALSLLAPLAFVACLNGTEPTDYPNIPIESTSFASNLNVNLATSTKTSSGLYYRDIQVGTGNTAAVGDNVSVYYQGNLSNGQTFDQRIPPNTPFTFKLGEPGFITGWTEGITGMKVGTIRQIIIPPALAYGAAGNYPAIPPNAVLVFHITLNSTTPAGS
jgi:FKBP-type peptidyl-prolyl cis-trans isomerase FkpA